MAQKDLLLTAPYDIPPEVQQMAKEVQLGELRKVYGASNHNIKKTGIIFTITGGVFLGILALILILLTVLGNIDAHFSPEIMLILMLYLGLPFLILGLAFLLPGCNMAFRQGIYPYWHIYLWQNGFVYEKGKLRQVFRWNQIASIESNVKQVEYYRSNGRHTFVSERTIYFYKVRNRDGGAIEPSNIFPEIAELIDAVLEESAQQLAYCEINVAHPKSIVAFTSFALDRQGIGNDQEKVSWEEIQEIAMKNGAVVVRKVE